MGCRKGMAVRAADKGAACHVGLCGDASDSRMTPSTSSLAALHGTSRRTEDLHDADAGYERLVLSW